MQYVHKRRTEFHQFSTDGVYLAAIKRLFAKR